ncbi:hypothetical protein BMS3Bbin06_01583 [bacterium BMS3Bbin06]|nr:hypothetical protein BMS3Bbin06_01583 [bacterium BMS3Bbin06]
MFFCYNVLSRSAISSAEFSLRRDFSTVPVSFRYILETRPRVSRNRFGIADVEASLRDYVAIVIPVSGRGQALNPVPNLIQQRFRISIKRNILRLRDSEMAHQVIVWKKCLVVIPAVFRRESSIC